MSVGAVGYHPDDPDPDARIDFAAEVNHRRRFHIHRVGFPFHPVPLPFGAVPDELVSGADRAFKHPALGEDGAHLLPQRPSDIGIEFDENVLRKIRNPADSGRSV